MNLARTLLARPVAPVEKRWDPFGLYEALTVGGNQYLLPVQTTWPGQKAEAIPNSFAGYVQGGLYGNGVIFGLERVRLEVFSQGRFQFQDMTGARPGKLYGTQALVPLEAPWPGGTTGDLLAVALLDADLAGSAYLTLNGDGGMLRLRPDWVDIILAERPRGDGMAKVGYRYQHGGRTSGATPVFYLPNELCHFAPQPDPLAWFRGMSWLTPVIREIQSDSAATAHKLKFFENAATPNLAVNMKERLSADDFERFVNLMDAQHQGVQNAYRTLYTANGADVTVIGADMKQLEFKVTQGAGETRLALAAGVPPTVAGLSEGLQGSSLNAGNFGQARRQFSDITLAHLWSNVAGSLQTIIPAPVGSRLTVDTRDVPFLREDQKDAAEIQAQQAAAIRTLIEAGYTAESVIAAVGAGDWSLLVHTGLVSVQLQEPGATVPAPRARRLSVVRDANGMAVGMEER